MRESLFGHRITFRTWEVVRLSERFVSAGRLYVSDRKGVLFAHFVLLKEEIVEKVHIYNLLLTLGKIFLLYFCNRN